MVGEAASAAAGIAGAAAFPWASALRAQAVRASDSGRANGARDAGVGVGCGGAASLTQSAAGRASPAPTEQAGGTRGRGTATARLGLATAVRAVPGDASPPRGAPICRGSVVAGSPLRYAAAVEAAAVGLAGVARAAGGARFTAGGAQRVGRVPVADQSAGRANVARDPAGGVGEGAAERSLAVATWVALAAQARGAGSRAIAGSVGIRTTRRSWSAAGSADTACARAVERAARAAVAHALASRAAGTAGASIPRAARFAHGSAGAATSARGGAASARRSSASAGFAAAGARGGAASARRSSAGAGLAAAGARGDAASARRSSAGAGLAATSARGGAASTRRSSASAGFAAASAHRGAAGAGRGAAGAGRVCVHARRHAAGARHAAAATTGGIGRCLTTGTSSTSSRSIPPGASCAHSLATGGTRALLRAAASSYGKKSHCQNENAGTTRTNSARHCLLHDRPQELQVCCDARAA
jgi:hypothetical protein